jgi:hypothetical protein
MWVNIECQLTAKSSEVPRKLTSIAASMNEDLEKRITDILLAITEADLEQMAHEQSQYGTPWKWHFQVSNQNTEIEIARFETLMNLVEGAVAD